MNRKTIGVLALVLAASVLVTGTLRGKEKKLYKVAVKLERVEREPALTDKEPVKVQDGQVFDSVPMAVAWAPGPKGFRFRIYNKTNKDISILWNECIFINEKGNRYNISHKGVKRPSLTKMKTMKPTVVRGGDNWQDVFFPFDSDYIEHQKELKRFGEGGSDAVNTYGKAGLRVRDIFTVQYNEKQVKKILKKERKKNKDATFESYIGTRTYGIEMALKLAETRYTYRYLFRAVLLEK